MAIFKKITASIGKLIKTGEEKEVSDSEKMEDLFPEEKLEDEKKPDADPRADNSND